ncbi:MAG: oligosaccharide flippase family protein [Candidatus Paceibacteria bacterium]
MKTRLITLLRWSEKYTKTDMVYLAKGGSWLLLSQGLLFILSFALLWVFANLMSQELYGQYRFLITVVGLLAITSLPGMNTAVIRSVARGTSGIIKRVIKTRILYGLLGSIAALIGASYYYYQGDSTLGNLFILIALFVPFYDSYAIFEAHLIGLKNYSSLTYTTVLRRLFIVTTTIAGIYFSQNIYFILAIYLVSTTISNYFTYLYTIKHFPLNVDTDNDTIPYGKQLSIMQIVTTAANHLDKIALWYLAGPIPLAVYTIAIALPKEIAGAFSQIGILALPKMSAQDNHNLQQSLLHKVGIFFIASLPLAILYIFFAPTIFRLFLPQYMDAVFLSQIAALIIMFTPSTLLYQYFSALMHTRVLFTMQFITPIILIILLFLLIPIFGTLGAISAVIVKQLIEFVFLIYFFIRINNTI